MSVGGTRVCCFEELRATIAERVCGGTEGLKDDLATLLSAPRKYWREETWSEALCRTDACWAPWKETEASIRHDNEEVVGWIEAFAKLADVNGPTAQKLAILSSADGYTDYVTPILRDCQYTSFTDTSFTAQVLEFYCRERLALVRSASLVAAAEAACREGGGASPLLQKLLAKRDATVAALSGSRAVGVDAVPGVRVDKFPGDRTAQRLLEQVAHLEYLICLNHAGAPLDNAAVIGELRSVLAADNTQSLRHTLAKHRSSLACPHAAGRCRTAVCAWITQSLVQLAPLNPGTTLKDVLGEPLYSFLAGFEGPEGALIHMVMLCLDYRDCGPLPHGTTCAGLATLKYLVTGTYTPPHGTDVQDVVPALDFANYPYLIAPYKEMGRRVLRVLTEQVKPAHATETQLLLLTRVAIACREGEEAMVEEVEGDDEKGGGHAALLEQLIPKAGWLFPSCVATTALLELFAAAPVEDQDKWWQCLSTLDKVAIEHPFDAAALGGDPTALAQNPEQRVMAALPGDATLMSVLTVPCEPEGRHRVPSGFGNWFAPLAPIPSGKHADEADMKIHSLNLSRTLAAPHALAQQVVTIWELPVSQPVNGWQWLLTRILHVVKLGRRAEPSEQWVVPFLELVSAGIGLIHKMLCGPDPAQEVQHFARCGVRRLGELEAHLRTLQAALGASSEAPWTLPLVIGDVLASLVTWQEARCYAVRAALVQQCSELLCALLRVSRAVHAGALVNANGRPLENPLMNVVEPVLTAFRSLFLPGKQSTRAPLLHLFWVVEASNKCCACTLGVVSILKELVSCPDDYGHLTTDLPDITSYICEVFTDVGNQWYHSSRDQWLLTYNCLHALVDVMKYTVLPRHLAAGVGAALGSTAKFTQFSTVNHILHHERMSRALATMIGSVTAAAFDRDRAQRGPPAHLSSKVLLLALEALEHALVACEGITAEGQPLPKLVQILCEPDASVSLKMVDKYSLPGLLFQNAAYAADDRTKIQAMRTFTLLCAIADNGSLLRHIGYRAGSTGRTFLNWIDTTTAAGAWTRVDLSSFDDPELRYACEHGLLHPAMDDSKMPRIFNARPEVHIVWQEASLGTCRFLALLRMMTSMVTHQPQLFMQAFLDQGASMSDPIGSLLRTFVVNDNYVEPRPMVKEAILALLVAGLQAREPCRSRLLARTSPTLAIKIVVDSPGIGDTLAGREGRGCPWDHMPVLSEALLQPLKDVLAEAAGADADASSSKIKPCLLFDGSRSWTQCGFVRRSADVVECPLSFVVGGINSHPSADQRSKILKAAAGAAKKAFQDAGFKTLELTASEWVPGRTVNDPQVWPIVAESLAASRHYLGLWMASATADAGNNGSTAVGNGNGDDGASGGESSSAAAAAPHQAGEMSWHILIAAHALRALAVVESLRLVFPIKKYAEDPSLPCYETAQLVTAVHSCVVRVLGKWGDVRAQSPTAGVLGMMVPTEVPVSDTETVKLDGVLGQACGLFYGAVKVPVLPSYFTGGGGSAGGNGARSEGGGSVRGTPRVRQPYRSTPIGGGGVYAGRPTPSPRRPAGDGSPRMLSPLMRPAFADTPTWDTAATQHPASMFPPTPMDMDLAPPNGGGVDTEDLIVADGPSEQLTLYEMLRKAEAEVLLALSDSGVGDQLVPPANPETADSAAALATLRSCAVSHINGCGVAPSAAAQMPGAFINMRFLEASYGQCQRLLRVCAELNDVVSLASAAFSLLRSVAQLISVLLKSPCPFSDAKAMTMMLPTHALLNPSDWRKGKRSSLVYIILQQCLLYPPHDIIDPARNEQDPSVLVSLLDTHIRSEACKLLADVVSECCSRSVLVAEGRLESSERPFSGPNDKYIVHRHIVWQVLEVLQAVHAIKDDNDVGLGSQTSRKGASRAGEADLLLTLCLLGRPDGVAFKTEGLGGALALSSALFPHLHQYLAMGDFAGATQIDIDCYKTAFIALCTFGVPPGQERHAVQLTRTLLQHLGDLHRCLEAELANRNRMLLHGGQGVPAAGGWGIGQPVQASKVQDVVERGLLILQGLRSIAASPTGAQVFAEADVVPFVAGLPLFHPPSADATRMCSDDAYAGGGRRQKAGAFAADDAVASPWSSLWQGILSTLSAAAIPPPIDGRKRDILPSFAAQVEEFVRRMHPRMAYLLSYPGLRRDISDETVRSLQLIACVARARLASNNALSASSPVYPWLLPLLHHSLDAIKMCLEAPAAGNTTRGTPQAAGDLLQTAAGADGAPAGEVDVKALCHLFDAASQVLSILRLHVVSFLPEAAPVGTSNQASPAVQRLLEALEMSSEVKGQSQPKRVNAACEAALNAPESCVRKLILAAGYPFESLKPHQVKHLRESILQDCAPLWTPSVASQELFVTSQRQLLFEDVAIFGTDDDLSVPAKTVVELMDAVTSKIGALLETDPKPAGDANGSGSSNKRDAKLGSAIKAATCTIEQAATLRQCYTACLELCAPTEAQSLWAGNVLQRLLNEKTVMHLVTVPGSVLRKRLIVPLAQLAQVGKTEEVQRVQTALAFHCIDELRRQPELTPWLVRPCHKLHAATLKAAARGDPQSKKLEKLVKSTIELLRRLNLEYHGTDLNLSS